MLPIIAEPARASRGQQALEIRVSERLITYADYDNCLRAKKQLAVASSPTTINWLNAWQSIRQQPGSPPEMSTPTLLLALKPEGKRAKNGFSRLFNVGYD